jgi:outer membrane protein TolC
MHPIKPWALESRFRGAFGVLLAGSMLLNPLRVRAEGPRVLRITLRQALQTALAQNPKAHLSLLAIAEGEEDRRMAASALLPSVGAQAFGQRAKNNLDAFIGTPTPHGPQVIGPFNWGQVGVEAKASLFDLSVWNRWKASQHAESALRAQGRAVREEIGALVVGQYLRALRAQAAIEATRSRVEVADALATLAENQQKQGVGTRLDSLRAQVQVQTERQRLIQAKTQLKVALAGLGKLLDAEPATEFELADSLAAPDFPAIPFQQAFDAGLKLRPELEALAAREKAAQSLRDAAQGLRLPTLVATAGYASTGLHAEPWAITYEMSLALRVPLFTGGLVSAQIARARTEEAKVQEARREVQAQVSLEVQVAQAELESARSEVEVAQLTVTLADEALLQARHRFEAGVSNNIELVNAQDEVARAQDNRISALYRLNQSRADLAKAMGQLESLFAN